MNQDPLTDIRRETFNMAPATPAEDPQVVYDSYCAHSSGFRVHTETTIQAALFSQYPFYNLTSTPCDLIAYAHAGHAIATLNEDVHPTLRSWNFEPATLQPLDGSEAGRLEQTILFGRFDYVWQDHRFQVFVVDGQNTILSQCDRRYYVLSQPATAGEKDQAGSEVMDALVLAASNWSEKAHDQVWVYDQGSWSKDNELWRMVHSGNWKDIILEESTKSSIVRDVIGFFDARETYAEFGTPWKRGLIFHGSPGNGKTTTAKVLMKALMARPKPVSTLVVKTLAQPCFPPQMSVGQIFTKARQAAPCLLLFEDVDSLVTDQVRSYFFNEVDGLANNEGILMIGSTNDLDKLHHGLSKRPSRFDRKYCFSNPSFEERVRYCEYWSKKLSSKPAAATPSTLPHHIASITDGFSFAYLKEAYVASLLTLVRDLALEVMPAEEEDDRKWGRFGNLLQQQAVALREDITE